MRFDDVRDGYLHVTQQKTGTRLRLPLALRLEPPMLGLYRWTAQDGVSCHFGHVQTFEGPYPI